MRQKENDINDFCFCFVLLMPPTHHVIPSFIVSDGLVGTAQRHKQTNYIKWRSKKMGLHMKKNKNTDSLIRDGCSTDVLERYRLFAVPLKIK